MLPLTRILSLEEVFLQNYFLGLLILSYFDRAALAVYIVVGSVAVELPLYHWWHQFASSKKDMQNMILKTLYTDEMRRFFQSCYLC